MTSNRPLPYPTWEYVLQYMSGDIRLALSKCYPALRNLDHRIPLRIQNLYVTKSEISINKSAATYRIGVIRIYPGGTPLDIQSNNNAGGSSNDLGDFYGDYEESSQRITEKKLESLEEEIRQQTMRVEDQRPFATNEWGKRFLQAFEDRIVDLRAEIEEIRRNGYIPPYIYYLQLISTTRFGRSVERFEYTHPISTAMKYLFKKITTVSNLVRVDTFKVNGLDVSLTRPSRRLELPTFDIDSPSLMLNGLEAELHFEREFNASDFVKSILENKFRSEKHITAGISWGPTDNAMWLIRTTEGAELGETPGHVIVPNGEQFKITFYLGEGDNLLHAKVERK